MIGAPLVVYLRKYVGKNMAAIIVLSLFLLGTFSLIWFVIPPLVDQVEQLSKIDYAKVVNALEEPIKDWEKWLVDKKLMMPKSTAIDTVAQKISPQGAIENMVVVDTDTTSKNQVIHVNIRMPDPEKSSELEERSQKNFFMILREQISTYLNPQKLQSLFNQALTAVGDIFIAVFSIFFIGFFFLKEQGLFVDMITAALPERYESQTKEAIDETSHLLIRYFAGILFQTIIIGTLISLSLLALGIKNALLIGFIAGVLNVIPYIGPMIATGIAILITISSNIASSFYVDLVPMLTKVIIVFFVVRMIDDIILQPNIFSKSVKAHPLEIFIVVMIGAKLGGVIGMILAIPFYTAFRVIGKEFFYHFKIIQELTRHM
jgi:predicted PurR-regulated permease PerM